VLEAGFEPAHPRGHYPLKVGRKQELLTFQPIVFYELIRSNSYRYSKTNVSIDLSYSGDTIKNICKK
jgi:hypothetical protein